MLSTLQDRGRYGQQQLGIVPGGVMDPFAHRMANALVGNADDEATLEITLIGPELEFEDPLLIAVSGAQFPALIDDTPLPLDRPVLVKAGSVLRFRQAGWGARAYLAVAGGWQVPAVLGSRSTYLPAGFGGFEGRALRAGDRLGVRDDAAELSSARWRRLLASLPQPRLTADARFASVRWFAPPMTLPNHDPTLVHAMPGQHFEWFSSVARREIFEATWRITPESNRIGYRMQGPELLRERAGDIISGPTCLGTVQVPANGQPIVLMADHQTSGGYAKMLEVASADCARLAQLGPGARIRFVRCSLDEALALRRRVNQAIAARTREALQLYR